MLQCITGYNTEKLLKFLRSEEQLCLIQEDFDILKNERICGSDFLELTIEEFQQFKAKLEQFRNQLEYDYTDYSNSVKKIGMRANKRRVSRVKEADILQKCLDFLKQVDSEDVKKRIDMLLQGFDKHRLYQDVNNFWNKIKLMCYKNEQKRLELERAMRTLQCHINIRDKTQNMMKNMAKKIVKEAENARKRSRSEFTKYKQNDERLSVLSLLLSKIQTTCGTEVKRTDNDSTFRNSDFALAQIAKVQKPRKYINRDIADNVLKNYQTSILLGEKLIFNGVNILDSTLSDIKKMKKTEVEKSLLNIRNSEAVNFADGKKIDKFIVDCDEQVLNYLDKFYEVDDLETLERCLTENHIDISITSNDLIYVQNLFYHFFFLFKNDFLTQNMSEYEFNSYIWMPLLRNAFLEKSDLKLNYGELEDGVLDTRGKRKGNLQKLEYYLKVILTALFITLPSSTKANITNIETYSIQSNGFRLTISVLKYLFEDIIITIDLQDVEVPRTIEGFSNLIIAVKVILS
ncbi:16323_t:CDS:10 [Funneliformis caledonium]|uniref:16323_t:CDS:1 n=1 Tax=Funneliformis caledonium TaxID=1117310 RepID=A0A9N9GEJ1_9GLOM|nr:16323_t:CDS:10 [Funneliformis caledonium]